MKLSVREKASYGVGAIGKDMVYSLVSTFILIYYKSVLGVSGVFIGTLFMFARVFDAVNDPFMGIIVEKTKTKYGKFRPWIFIGTILNAMILYGMFAVPESITGNALKVYISVAYILWGMTYTVMDIPFWSMIPAISSPGKDRENITVIARSCAGFGYAIPTALTMLFIEKVMNNDMRVGFRIFTAIVAVFFVIAETITVLNVKEKARDTVKQKSTTIKDMLSALMHNDQALIVVVAIIIFNGSLYLTNQLGVYFFKYDIGNGSLFGLFGTIGGVAQILAMLALPVLRKKYECKKILTGAIITTLVGYGILLLFGMLQIKNAVLLCGAAIIIFIGFGLATVLTTIFLADTVDYGEWKNNQRNESVIFSLQTFVVKLASAVSGFVAGVGLDLIKFDEDLLVQTNSTLYGLRFLMIVIPMIGLICSIIFFTRKYKLNESMLSRITHELKERE
ncbi:MAG: glycoside-pentoside-hexuronide (GPH):cation symporter [Clostridiales bacterium]|nr:glycoside-pentoside-hexuronide (GPH):cation symporter [Clostridiales bacterium]